MNKNNKIQKQIIDNIVRCFLKEMDITHLDAIIALVQSHKLLLNSMEKKLGKHETIEVIRTIESCESEILLFASNLTLQISDLIEKVRVD